MSDDAEFLSVESAGSALGVSSRTIRSWIAAGKLPAIAGHRGRLVRRADVLHIGVLTGRLADDADMPDDSANASRPAAERRPIVGERAGQEQLETIREEWLQPLIRQIAEQAAALGRVTAERDALRDQLAERDDPREIERLREARDTLRRDVERLRAEAAWYATRSPHDDEMEQLARFVQGLDDAFDAHRRAHESLRNLIGAQRSIHARIGDMIGPADAEWQAIDDDLRRLQQSIEMLHNESGANGLTSTDTASARPRRSWSRFWARS
jgi:excisionase family DNA binding protein